MRELREALAQIKKGFKESNLTHARELEPNRKHARELEEANRTHARQLAEVREEWKKAKETYEREKNEASSPILPGQSIRVSH